MLPPLAVVLSVELGDQSGLGVQQVGNTEQAAIPMEDRLR